MCAVWSPRSRTRTCSILSIAYRPSFVSCTANDAELRYSALACASRAATTALNVDATAVRAADESALSLTTVLARHVRVEIEL